MGLRAITMALCLILTNAVDATEDSRAKLDADITKLMAWYEGDWDNNLQVVRQQTMDPEGHWRRHASIFRRIDMPHIGPNVLFAQKWYDDDPDNIYVVNLYVLSPNYELGHISFEILEPEDKLKYRDAHIDEQAYQALKEIKVDDYIRMPFQCASNWVREGDMYFATFPGPCHLGNMPEPDGRDAMASTDIRMTEEQLWVLSSSKDRAGNTIQGNGLDQPRKEIKVDWYSCTMRVSNKVIPDPLPRFGNPPNGADGVARFRNLFVHDQGGQRSVTVRSTPAEETYKLRLTNLREPQEVLSDEPLKLEVFKDGAEEPVLTSIAQPGAETLGLQGGDIYVRCNALPGNWFHTIHRPERSFF